MTSLPVLCSAWGYKFEERMSMSAPRDMENGTAHDDSAHTGTEAKK